MDVSDMTARLAREAWENMPERDRTREKFRDMLGRYAEVYNERTNEEKLMSAWQSIPAWKKAKEEAHEV